MTDASHPQTLACLGPEGSFSHLLTQMRFPDAQIQLLAGISEVFDFIRTHPQALGIVPIENSSGGFIIDTVDRLVDERCGLHILEELTLDVKLALLGRHCAEIKTIHSHAMPFFHSDEWLKANYPDAKRIVEASTAKAAEKAATQEGAAAIGPRQNAQRHSLDILHFPIAGEVPNITQFFLLGHAANPASTSNNRTALVVELPDRPGSLCRFLTPLSDSAINMKRLESRPIRGQPNKYRFYIEIEGSPADPHVQSALAETLNDGASIRSLGSYPAGHRFES
ncbi:chorismate mutase/prephenate dehydratase [Prosthecobacter fusiformis]|uniref:prephenate dehydratase n=1 Tax=Prosthecobacter fusiformis TaxID=48464 RepID=A0A4R7RRN7_9BACT|nr:prephenate dehydratase domain-containing protein [Prosthecobacter fusiformis]TDU68190.1 chorismate mutase/prephenate dehydratase [Prosthecobacter fusiformis]